MVLLACQILIFTNLNLKKGCNVQASSTYESGRAKALSKPLADKYDNKTAYPTACLLKYAVREDFPPSSQLLSSVFT